MKIYADRKLNYSITDFIGKDLWVRCYSKSDRYDKYIKPIATKYNLLTYSEMYAGFIDDMDLGMGTIDEMIESLDYLHHYYIEDFEVRIPLDTYTTEELIDLIRNSVDPSLYIP